MMAAFIAVLLPYALCSLDVLTRARVFSIELFAQIEWVRIVGSVPIDPVRERARNRSVQDINRGGPALLVIAGPEAIFYSAGIP
jgi:hypothetical protein